ncbi:MAG: type II toxin-antitoxin system RelE/ParE family toxin [Sulfuricella sp.]|nr:type II toxin-antitoxin system RelE/ParE family toxin [Sulfuricella sp.]
MKPLKFIGSSEDDLAAFPNEAKGAAGHELWQMQLGLMPSDWKPVMNIGAGAYEIRVHVLGEWRVIYVAKFADAIYVLHAFQKKTQQTSKEDIALASARYKQLKESSK